MDRGERRIEVGSAETRACLIWEVWVHSSRGRSVGVAGLLYHTGEGEGWPGGVSGECPPPCWKLLIMPTRVLPSVQWGDTGGIHPDRATNLRCGTRQLNAGVPRMAPELPASEAHRIVCRANRDLERTPAPLLGGLMMGVIAATLDLERRRWIS